MKKKVVINEKTERIICGDNLEVLKSISDESVDLIYIDPPFFTSKNYAVIWNDGEEIRQFGDRWITENRNGTGKASKDINVYLEWMESRIKEIYRVLKKTGSLYLHCDKHADAYLRVLCDDIFGHNNFINEIVWHYKNKIGRPTRKFLSNYDTILFYTKSKAYTFNLQFVEIDNPLTLKRYDKMDENGKKYKIYHTNGVDRKVYLKPKSMGAVWEINNLSANSKERYGYPTQKPEKLLERIIKASSNKGDIVLDCFCGCGTTLAVAKKLDRQFIGIDVSPTACRLVAKRLRVSIKHIEGLPITKEEIATLDGNEFQNWVIHEFGGFSGNRGPDGGIDGYLGKCPIQVKKHKAGRNDLDQFSGSLLREGSKEAIYIALHYSVDFKKEVARLKRENSIIIHFFTVEDIINKIHYPIVNKFIPKKGLDKFVTKKGVINEKTQQK